MKEMKYIASRLKDEGTAAPLIFATWTPCT